MSIAYLTELILLIINYVVIVWHMMTNRVKTENVAYFLLVAFDLPLLCIFNQIYIFQYNVQIYEYLFILEIAFKNEYFYI